MNLINLVKKFFLYFLAFVCIICPLCIIARAKPQSGWAKFVRGLSKICPFCLAYSKIKNIKFGSVTQKMVATEWHRKTQNFYTKK